MNKFDSALVQAVSVAFLKAPKQSTADFSTQSLAGRDDDTAHGECNGEPASISPRTTSCPSLGGRILTHRNPAWTFFPLTFCLLSKLRISP